jgi:hypothetical protein
MVKADAFNLSLYDTMRPMNPVIDALNTKRRLLSPWNSLVVGAALSLALLLGACGEADQTKAREAVSWMRMHKYDGQANPIWKITKLEIKDAENIVVEILVPNEQHVDAIRSKSLIRKAMIAKYACPPPTAAIWDIVKDDIQIRVDLHDHSVPLGSGICQPPKQ